MGLEREFKESLLFSNPSPVELMFALAVRPAEEGADGVVGIRSCLEDNFQGNSVS